VAALKRFQSEYHLHVTGVFGQESAHALDRAVRLEKARRRRGKRPVRPPGQRPGLADLVTRYRHFDAETGRAWKELAAYGDARRAAVKRAHVEAGDEVTLADIAEILRRIEHEIQDLGEHKPEPAPAAVMVATAITDNPTLPAPAPVALANATAAPPAPPAPAPVARKPIVLDDLTDAQLSLRVERLDHMLDEAREVLIARYVEAARQIAHARKQQQQHAPAITPKPGVIVTQRPPHGPRTEKPHIKPVHSAKPSVEPASPGTRKLQMALNAFTRRYLKGLGPIATDGKLGPQTKGRLRTVKYYLGYTGAAHRSTAVDAKLLKRMRSPHSARHANPAMLSRAARRRRQQRKHLKVAAAPRAGVSTFDKKPVAAWMKPYLVYARKHGWQGTLISGYRTPEHSESICIGKCGAKSCPGNCAGRSSNHSQRVKPFGAIDVDVTHRDHFARLMAKCPYEPKLVNHLASDRNHFSVQGN